MIEEGTGPIFTLQYAVSDEAPVDECRALTTENVEATDTNGFDLQVISSQGAYCFAADVEPGDSDEDGILDADDNCPDIYNPVQEDLDEDGYGDACDEDIDGDDFLNDEDVCPRSNTEPDPEIIMDDCETGVVNYDFMNGCLMSDLIDQCEENAQKRSIFVFGRYVRCVSHLTNEWKKDRLIQRKEKGAILKCAVRSKVPWIRLPWWWK